MPVIKISEEAKQKLHEHRTKHGHSNYSDTIHHLIGSQVTNKVTEQVTEHKDTTKPQEPVQYRYTSKAADIMRKHLGISR